MRPTFVTVALFLLASGTSCTQAPNQPKIGLPTSAVAQRALEEFAQAASIGDFSKANSRMSNSEAATCMLKATCNFRRAWSAFHTKLASVHGHEAANSFPNVGQYVFHIAILTLDGPKLLLLVEPGPIKDVGCIRTGQGDFVTVDGEMVALIVYAEDSWRLSMDSGRKHTTLMATGLDAIARIYDRFQARIGDSEETLQGLEASTTTAIRDDPDVHALTDTSAREGFRKGMPMP